ncbi:MAG: PEP-CTERM sorting domain-containing protein [Verrucomicrobia bacterium]|nr:PEP-CTERM sorting domain-containing protein [Verrucomicrobiota bacterium]MCH8512736.1 PEP-CTERM sorting domain-containing protein [Kiritimatiellia bacterium]
MKKQLFHSVTVAFLLTAILPVHAQTFVDYREIFPRPTGASGPASMADYGWFAHRGPDATQITAHTTTSGSPQWAVSAGTGRPDNLAAVNSNPPNDGEALGFAFFYANATEGSPVLLWTNEHSTDLVMVQQFDWWQGNQTGTDGFRLAIQVGTDWYVSAQNNTQSAGVSTFSTQAEQMTQLMAGSSWNTLNFTSGSTLSMGTAALLPETGTISAFGLFAETHTQNTSLRFDTFTVTAIPEPSTVVLLGIALISAFALKRRHSA